MLPDNFFRRALSRIARDTVYRDMNDGAAFELLNRTALVLEGLGIPWWLNDGTLLGFYRDGGFIGHDIDIDLGLPASAYSPALESALLNAGLEIYSQYGTPENGLEMTVRSRWLYLPGTSLDLFFFYDDGDSWWNAVYYKGNQLRFRYPKFETRSLRVRGFDYPIPDNTDRVLEAKYGPTWRVPDRGWDNMLSPLNLEVGHLSPRVRRMIHARRAQIALAKSRRAPHPTPASPRTIA